MIHARWGILSISFIAALGSPQSARGQERSAWFGDVTLGPAFPDRQGNEFRPGSGFVVQGRVGRRLGSTLSAIAELTHTSFNREGGAEGLAERTALAIVPCVDPEDPLCNTGGAFTGPVSVVVAGAGVEASTGNQTAALFASLAPGLYWLYDRAPGTNGVAGGVGLSLGGAVRFAEPLWAVVDVHYHRLFSEGQNPRWLVPLSFGLQVR
jgi:hypothetical protein